MNTVTVYIDRSYLLQKSKYLVRFDFRTNEDFNRFCEVTEIEKREDDASMIEIIGLHSTKPIMEDAYYTLNLEAFRQFMSFSRDTQAVAGRVNADMMLREGILIGFNAEGWNGDAALFSPHEPFNDAIKPEGISFDSPDIQRLPFLRSPLELRVNNVGQGNWNEIRGINGHVLVVYDIGASIFEPRDQTRALSKSLVKDYDATTPVLVLSHWDFDHYGALLGLPDEKLSMFSRFICPKVVLARTIEKVYNRMNRVLGKENITILNSPYMPNDASPLHKNDMISSSNVSLYMGSSLRKRNHGGIGLFITGEHKTVSLTGDYLLSQAEFMANNETPNLPNVLIVPHHGGKCEVDDRHYNVNPQCKLAIISSGKNPYGHPSGVVMDYLHNGLHLVVKRTDELDNQTRYISEPL